MNPKACSQSPALLALPQWKAEIVNVLWAVERNGELCAGSHVSSPQGSVEGRRMFRRPTWGIDEGHHKHIIISILSA